MFRVFLSFEVTFEMGGGGETPTYPSCVKSWGWYVVMKYVFVYCSGHVRLIMFLMSFLAVWSLRQGSALFGWCLLVGFDAVEHTQQCVPVVCPWCVNAFNVAAPGGRFSSVGMQSWVLQGNLLPWTLVSWCWLLSPGTVQFWHKHGCCPGLETQCQLGSTVCSWGCASTSEHLCSCCFLESSACWEPDIFWSHYT